MAETPPSDAQGTVSSALLANLAETRREVVVPEEYRALLEPVEQFFGVRRTVEKLLVEVFHPLRNLGEIATGLRSVCGGMFSYYERSPERARCAALLDALLGSLYAADPDEEVLHDLLGAHLQLLVTLSGSRYSEEYREVLLAQLERLVEVQHAHPTAFLAHSALIRRTGRRLGGDDAVAEALAGLYRGVVDQALRLFDAGLDGDGWCGGRSGAECGVAEKVLTPLEATLRRTEAGLGRADLSPEEVFALPHVDDLLDLVLEGLEAVPASIDRIAFYVRLAGVDALQHRNMEILRTLHVAIKTVCEEGGEEDIVRAADLITDQLRAAAPRHKRMLYRCLEKLGEGIARRASARLAEHFVERTIATGFESPEITGVSADWEVDVNPHHLPCLRAWLAIIEQDPIGFERLLSALVVNLHFKGVFVADTDLFQRDISALLNTDVADAFNLILQLVRFFPVFFNEVGSEGELRDASTRIDQLWHRKDPVIHFLRKQCHAESNNRLIGFARAVWTWWRTGDGEVLRQHVPDALLEELEESQPWYEGAHRLVRRLSEDRGLTEADLDTVTLAHLRELLESVGEGSEVDRERIELLVRIYRLLKAKYAFTPEAVLPAVEQSSLVSAGARRALLQACGDGGPLDIVRAGNRVLDELKAVIVSTEVTEAFENILLKRHIAAGIPSMYGTYREPKFDAMGLMLRLIQFLKPQLEACVDAFSFRYMTRESIQQALELMEELVAGLRLAGLRVHHLTTKLDILRSGIRFGHLSASQYLNIFDFMADALADAIETNYIALHGGSLAQVARQQAEADGVPDEDVDEVAHRLSEEFLRSMIASTYAIQELDLFLRRIRHSLRTLTEALSRDACDTVLSYRPKRLVTHLDEELARHEDQVLLGYKGLALKRLAGLGLRVPPGFILSTELFDIRHAMTYEDLAADTRERIVAAVDRLEEISGRRLGDADRPLLLSVRSGSAFSMPGMMDTILDVGLSEQLAVRLARSPDRAWGVWDSWRRYLQNVAMSCGMDRDLFDETIDGFKDRYGVAKKIDLTAEQMREVALEYRRVASEHGITYHGDPLDQLMQAVLLVLASWDSEPARLYRERLQLSDDWGTGVIVQQMVFGNLAADAGSGVAFTRDPRSSGTGIGLFGDYSRGSQGEDVVAGLVRPYPISERQRLRYSPHLDCSLETEFPAIFARLREIASELILEHGFEHQEMEFTFESAAAEDLYLLQIRPMRHLYQPQVAVLARPGEAQRYLLATGIGVSGGAMVGVVALEQKDIRAFRRDHPEMKVVLLRPDTVPEDIDLILAADGLLTSRGGFTSHAAVTAKRLGKCCVVNCGDLEVSEADRMVRLGGRVLRPGDVLTIDGTLGRVYFGEQEVTAAPWVPRLE